MFWCICVMKCGQKWIKTLQTLKNIFLRTWFLISFKDLIVVAWKCIKTRPDVEKYLFKGLNLMVWKYAQMHQNTFLTTPGVEKYLFLRTWFWRPWNASKHVFNHSRRWKISFLRTWLLWPGNASKQVFNSSKH